VPTRLLRSLCAGACLLVAQLANAGAIDKLHQFLDIDAHLRADFAQTVVARNGRQGQVSSGVMIILTPRQVPLADRQAVRAAARRRRREDLDP
jgi:hypothetical protein